MTNGINGFNPQQMGFSGNPEADAMRYAQQKGISLEEAKNELRSKFGDPQPPVQNSVFGGSQTMQLPNIPINTSLFNYQSYQQPQAPQTPEQMICAQYGIPPEIAAQGDDAIRKFAQDNNISLPAKGNSQTQSNVTVTNASANAKTSSNSSANKTNSSSADLEYYNTMKKYEEVARNTKMSKAEKDNITRETKAHNIEFSAWTKEYRTQKKAELKAELAKCSDKDKKKYLKRSYDKIINDPALVNEYVQTKFKEKYPDKDFNAVTYNIVEQQRSWLTKGPAGWSHHYVSTEKAG